MDMRGLAHFIRDVRKATGNRKEEENRVQVELAKIRAFFVSTGHMTLYDRKKYVCKLMFISMLGYPITFGHMEGIKLMAEKTPAEKLIGYLSATVLVNESSDLLNLTTHTVYRDLMSGNDINRGLALSLIANIGSKEFSEVMCDGVQQTILSDDVDKHVRKRALLTLLRIYQRYPEMVDLPTVIPKVVELLMCGQDGVGMCAAQFLSSCFSKQNEHLFIGVPAKMIELLARIIVDKQTEPGYVYYGVPAPWLQCVVLRFLQLFPIPTEPTLHDRIILILRKIIKATDKVLKDAQTQQKQRGAQNRVSVMNAVLFEVVSLAIQWDVGPKVILECVSVITNFISDKREANLRYIGLALLSRLSFVESMPEFDFQAHCKQYQQQIVVGLHDSDVSIRRKALEVLVAMCNPATASDIIKELLTYLPIVTDPIFKGNLVLALALLSEKYCDDSSTYVDILLNVVAQAGELCPPDVVYRVVHVIVNNASVQKRAANFSFNALRNRHSVHKKMLSVAAFVLGEFGYQIALNADSTPQHQFALLKNQMEYADTVSSAMILTTLFKFYNLYDDVAVRAGIVDTLTECKSSVYPELQQRATEFLALIDNGNMELIEKVLDPTPSFPDEVNVALDRLKKLQNRQDIWAEKLIARETVHTPTPVPDSKQSPHPQEQSGSLQRKRWAAAKDGRKRVSSAAMSVKLDDLFSARGDASKASKSGPASAESLTLDKLLSASLSKGTLAVKETYQRHRQLFTALLASKKGVLFSDSNMEVRCEQIFHLADCRLMLVASNNSSGVLHSVQLELLGSEAGLFVQTRPKEEEWRAADGGLQSGGRLSVEIAARSLAPFHDPPSIRLQYIAGSQTAPATVHILSLPIVTSRFVSPYDMDSEGDYLQLFDSVKRTTHPLTQTLTSTKASTRQDVLRVLTDNGFHPCTSAQGTLIAVGAHATQPSEKVNYTPVTCEVAQTSSATLLSVYAAEADVQQVALETLALLL